MSELQEQTSREALHQRIIDVAGEEFRKHGIRSVRMDDLSSLLGISKRTLYEEFEESEGWRLSMPKIGKNLPMCWNLS